MLKLYTTHCPSCDIVEAMLKEKNIEYQLIDDEDAVYRAADLWGFTTVPFAFEDGVVYSPNELREYACNGKKK